MKFFMAFWDMVCGRDREREALLEARIRELAVELRHAAEPLRDELARLSVYTDQPTPVWD